MANELDDYDMALSICDRIKAGTLNLATYNGIMKSVHAQIVCLQQPSRATQPNVPLSQLHGPPAQSKASPTRIYGHPEQAQDRSNPVVGPSSYPASDPQKRKRADSTDLTDADESTLPENSNEALIVLSSSPPAVPSTAITKTGSSSKAQCLAGQTATNPKETVQQSAKQTFIEKWEPVISQRTRIHGAITQLFTYEDLATTQSCAPSTVPFAEIDVLMGLVEEWGSHGVKDYFILELQQISLLDQRRRPALVRPTELQEFETHMQEDLYELWKAARLADYWCSHGKNRYRVLRLLALFKEIHVYRKIMASQYEPWSLNSCTQRRRLAQGQVSKMYARFHASSDMSSQLLRYVPSRAVRHWPYLGFLSALDDQYQSEGIIAMVPHKFFRALFENTKRGVAIIKVLTLLKPEFQDPRQLRTCSEVLNKAYHGQILDDDDLDRVAQCYTTASAVQEPTEDSDRPTTKSPDPHDSDSNAAPGSSDAVSGALDEHDLPTDPALFESATAYLDSAVPNAVISPSSEDLFPNLPTTEPKLASKTGSKNSSAPVATNPTPAGSITSKVQLMKTRSRKTPRTSALVANPQTPEGSNTSPVATSQMPAKSNTSKVQLMETRSRKTPRTSALVANPQTPAESNTSSVTAHQTPAENTTSNAQLMETRSQKKPRTSASVANPQTPRGSNTLATHQTPAENTTWNAQPMTTRSQETPQPGLLGYKDRLLRIIRR
ncbi:MAG: hypothetical protein Q9168_004915 [Polycauliona sp. 1 TL-2023]